MSKTEIVLNWLRFLGECLLIALVILLSVMALRWLGVGIKRLCAVAKLKRTAREFGYGVTRRGMGYFAIGKKQAPTAFVLKRGEREIHVHFVTTFGKARILRFLAPDAYIIEKTVGFFALNTSNVFSLNTAKIFKPKNVSGNTLQWSHTDSTAFPSGTIRLRGMENLEANREKGIEDVVILNPAPMKAFWLAANSWQPIVGGETIFGVAYHDMESFCSHLKRS